MTTRTNSFNQLAIVRVIEVWYIICIFAYIINQKYLFVYVSQHTVVCNVKLVYHSIKLAVKLTTQLVFIFLHSSLFAGIGNFTCIMIV